MTKPIASAQIDGSHYGHRGVETVEIRRSKAIGCVAQFYAPGWRPMAFRTVEAAKAKMERHPGFAGYIA